ncbi:hypothetical protein DV515_00007634 [Chloebia gouldiae]|uniref:Uncharacterized protein n=1 Tax=Chloebia gouldiae TaxID=44316 RepID=A0A3L8SI39_CHLGU|nr:hypothetical protein DV515_00007634 [Chloebia gouldiae]
MCGPATCGVCSVCGERSGPGPTCGAGGADTADTTTPSQSRAGGFLSGIPGGNRRRKILPVKWLTPQNCLKW